MTDDRAARAEAIFLEAIEKPVAERAAFASHASDCEPELLRDVLSMLESAQDAERFLASVAAGVGAPHGTEQRAQDACLEGQRVGPYRLVRELGRGGIGTVYLGERDDGAFEQRVAIKLLRRGLDTDDILARFRTERQILASLNHPHIAHLLDGGATEDGRPYLVMELVEGLPITEYCDRHRCTIAERLRLFVQIVRAVQYAHGNLILHRDIKPSNILVAADGTPKLLDFGIAKLLDTPSSLQQSPRTMTGVRLMTPEYASPEQLRGEPATTASDTYQLGMLLYRLLAGRRPYRTRGLALEEIDRAIDDQLQPPSSGASSMDPTEGMDGEPTPEEVARLRGTDLRRLRATLRGDLDTIVLKAIRREPERRYAAAGGLADDIERYLSGRPVAARPDTFGYRARRFVSRHPVPVVAAVLAVFALGAYVGTLQSHATRLERERDRAEQALQRAELETSKAEQVTAFISRLFEEADPANARGTELTVREVLDRGRERAENLPADPEVRAELLSVMGRVYLSLGLHEPTIPLAQEALALRRQLHGDRHVSVVHSFRLLGGALSNAGDDRGAEQAYREALALGRDLFGRDHLIIAETLEELALVQGRPASIHSLREALAIRRASGADDRMTAERLAQTGQTRLEERQAAVRAQENEVDTRRRTDGNDHPGLVNALYQLGWRLAETGQYESAVSSFREGLGLSRRVFGTDHPSTVWGLFGVGTHLRQQGDLTGAEQILRELLVIQRRTGGTARPHLIETLLQLSWTLQGQGDYAGAEQILREVLDLNRTAHGDSSRQTTNTLHQLGRLEVRRGNLLRAESLHREALALRAAEGGPPWGENLLGMVLQAKGDLHGAEVVYRSALSMKQEFGSDNVRAAILINLGGVLMDLGDLDGAESFLREGVDLHHAINPDDSRFVVKEGANQLERLAALRSQRPPSRP